MFFLVFPLGTEAYIPAYEMILSQLARSQGRGGYRLDQKVVLKQGAEPLALKETWWVEGANRMRVDVRAHKKELKDLYLRFIYTRTKKIFRDETGKLQKKKLPYRHLDRPFHLRSSKELKKLFSLWKIASFQVPKRKERASSDSFIKLSRKGGVVQYQIGKNQAKVWIEQDEFVIRSWEWKDGRGQLQAWDYKLYPNSLFFPQQRILRLDSGETLIQVQKIQSLKLRKKFFQISQLSKKNKLPAYLSSSDQDRIREFYENFR